MSEPTVKPLFTFGWARLGRRMPLRDYLMAHAPMPPQSWFKPVMPTPEPQAPEFLALPDDLTIRLPLMHWWHRKLDETELPAAAQEWLASHTAATQAAEAWRAEYEKQRHVQWPAAWADAVLKAEARP